jgi:NAD-specific glutamate dehydrogenase
MTENLPTFFLEMLSSSEHEENVNQVDIYIKFKRDQQEIQEAITLLRTLKHCDKVFFRARTYLLSGLTAILERLPECKIF